MEVNLVLDGSSPASALGGALTSIPQFLPKVR